MSRATLAFATEAGNVVVLSTTYETVPTRSFSYETIFTAELSHNAGEVPSFFGFVADRLLLGTTTGTVHAILLPERRTLLNINKPNKGSAEVIFHSSIAEPIVQICTAGLGIAISMASRVVLLSSGPPAVVGSKPKKGNPDLGVCELPPPPGLQETLNEPLESMLLLARPQRRVFGASTTRSMEGDIQPILITVRLNRLKTEVAQFKASNDESAISADPSEPVLGTLYREHGRVVSLSPAGLLVFADTLDTVFGWFPLGLTETPTIFAWCAGRLIASMKGGLYILSASKPQLSALPILSPVPVPPPIREPEPEPAAEPEQASVPPVAPAPVPEAQEPELVESAPTPPEPLPPTPPPPVDDDSTAEKVYKPAQEHQPTPLPSPHAEQPQQPPTPPPPVVSEEVGVEGEGRAEVTPVQAKKEARVPELEVERDETGPQPDPKDATSKKEPAPQPEVEEALPAPTPLPKELAPETSRFNSVVKAAQKQLNAQKAVAAKLAHHPPKVTQKPQAKSKPQPPAPEMQIHKFAPVVVDLFMMPPATPVMREITVPRKEAAFTTGYVDQDEFTSVYSSFAGARVERTCVVPHQEALYASCETVGILSRSAFKVCSGVMGDGCLAAAQTAAIFHVPGDTGFIYDVTAVRPSNFHLHSTLCQWLSVCTPARLDEIFAPHEWLEQMDFRDIADDMIRSLCQVALESGAFLGVSPGTPHDDALVTFIGAYSKFIDLHRAMAYADLHKLPKSFAALLEVMKRHVEPVFVMAIDGPVLATPGPVQQLTAAGGLDVLAEACRILVDGCTIDDVPVLVDARRMLSPEMLTTVLEGEVKEAYVTLALETEPTALDFNPDLLQSILKSESSSDTLRQTAIARLLTLGVTPEGAEPDAATKYAAATSLEEMCQAVLDLENPVDSIYRLTETAHPCRVWQILLADARISSIGTGVVVDMVVSILGSKIAADMILGSNIAELLSFDDLCRLDAWFG
ncbi:hypothetical protein J8273_3481 [Carpediemonas membranifera]|uniref:Uncharacterized protein n=1 Tax=Carpediemonas membranifera TaxID=201153 RepID=A0A8J6ASH8_9EUKA|nr:hypothetical protein J8273_3481 [Carpediemonas membranifera]|eukprot:KAG9393346.1 hypothetical protein J8273_3481 [Carpediemonas membranifera]